MNLEPENQPLTNQPAGRRFKPLTWFLLLAGASFFVVLVFSLIWGPASGFPEHLAFAAIASVGLAIAGGFIYWLCCWRRFRWVLFIAACLLTLFAVAHAVENWRGHRAWKHFQQAAAAKGERFVLASIIPPPVPDADNFAMAAIFDGLRNEMDPEYRRAHTGPGGLTNVQRFTFNPYRTNDRSYAVPLGTWIKAERTDLSAWQDYYRTSTVDSVAEFPVAPQPQAGAPASPAADVLLALSKFDPALEELREASRRPYSRFPLRYEDGLTMLLPHLAKLKGANQFLALRAIAELNSGQTDRALADITLSFRLVDCVRTEPILISHLVRIAQVHIALQPVWEGLADHRWNEAQLAALDAELARLDFLADYLTAMRGERVCSMEAVDYVRRTRDWSVVMDNSGESSPSSVKRASGPLLLRLVPSGWFDQSKAVMGRLHLELFLPAVNQEARTVSPSFLRQTGEALDKAFSHRTPYNVFAALFLPALTKSTEKFARGQACADLARVACALERHRLAHGSYPESLDALTPVFLAKLPHDVISAQPLKYRRTDAGQFLLYAVGWNETDDSGQIGLTEKGNFDWSKGDWVWRYPAK